MAVKEKCLNSFTGWVKTRVSPVKATVKAFRKSI
jgi:hypothetical protein